MPTKISVDLQVRLGRLCLKNPVIPASGTFDLEEYILENYDVGQLGALVCKSVTYKKQSGNCPPRLCETPAGLINAVGIPSEGLDAFIEDKLPRYRQLHELVIVSVAGHSIDDYRLITQRLNNETGVSAIELNLSCPNLGNGIPFATNRDLLIKVVKAARDETALPLIVKLSPNVTSISEMAHAAEFAGADIVALINTLTAMSIDVARRKPFMGNIVGGLSGPAVRPIAVRMVWETFKTVKIPIIGMGGIACGNDALEFMLAGASAVAVGTTAFCNPYIYFSIIEEITSYMVKNGFKRPKDLIGIAHNG